MQIDNGKIFRETVDMCYDCYGYGGCPTIAKLKEIEGKLKTVIQDCDEPGYKAKGVDL